MVLPCRTDEFIESGVELFINHVKQTSGIQFDPRLIRSKMHRIVVLFFNYNELLRLCFFYMLSMIQYSPIIFFRIGFIVDRELLTDRTEISARCEYLNHISEMVIVPIKNDEGLQGSPMISVSTEWPYIKQELKMNCTFHTRNGFRYMLTWKCPQCEDDTVCYFCMFFVC